MYAELGLSVVAADLDPQANLSSMFIEEDRLEELWPDGQHPQTVYGAIRPLLEGTGDVLAPHVEELNAKVGLVVGDLALAVSADELNSQWPDCLDRKPRAFRVISAFWRILEAASAERDASVVLIDVGPNLGAINRAALISAQHVVIPLAPDLYSLQGLKNLGPTLRRWRQEWQERRDRNPVAGLSLPAGQMAPAGYVVMQHAVRLSRAVKANDRWMARIPEVYHTVVLDDPMGATVRLDEDASCLSTLKPYRSLIPLAQEARKPMFFLKAADGAIGGHAAAVQECFKDFRSVAIRLAQEVGIILP